MDGRNLEPSPVTCAGILMLPNFLKETQLERGTTGENTKDEEVRHDKIQRKTERAESLMWTNRTSIQTGLPTLLHVLMPAYMA